MPRPSRLPALILATALALSAAGCGRAYRHAMERGDAFAQAGDWDAAAQEYRRATNMRPDEVEAQQKLQRALQRVSADRVARSREALAREDFPLALALARDAVGYDPQSQEARAAYVEARAALFARAESLLENGKHADALALARAARRVDRHDQEAAALEGRILESMATGSYDRAIRFLAAGKRGNALLAFREVETTRPGFRDAKSRAAEIQRSLEDELRFVLVVAPSEGESTGSIEPRVRDTLLRWAPEPSARLLATTDREPTNPAVHGVRIRSSFTTLARGHQLATFARSCEYVCGQDRVPNPAYDAISREVDDAERRVRAAEIAVRFAQRTVSGAQRTLTEATRAVERANKDEADRRAELDRCRLTRKSSRDCKFQKDRHDASLRARDEATERESDARRTLQQRQQDVTDAERKLQDERRDWERNVARLRQTPVTVLVDRVCTHNYGVEVHTFRGTSSLSLTAHVIGEPDPVNLPPKPLQTQSIDETFRPESGRCPEIAAGDPLHTPSDAELEGALASQAADMIRGEVLGWYKGYAQSYADDEAREKAAGRVEEANEARVRYLLTGPGLPPLRR